MSLAHAQKVKDVVPLLPVLAELHLGMSVEEFKNVNKATSEIFVSDEKSSFKENRVFGEEVGKGEIGLITEETVYYYFVQDRLARIEWKDKTGDLVIADARNIKKLLGGSFELSSQDKKSFFGGESGIFDATQELYQSDLGLELLFVASKPFFSITLTDVRLLGVLNKSNVFDKISDDYSIKQWDKQNSEEFDSPLSSELDYLEAIAGEARRSKEKTSNENRKQLVSEKSKGAFSEGTPKSKNLSSQNQSRWFHLMILFLVFVTGFIAIRIFYRKL